MLTPSVPARPARPARREPGGPVGGDRVGGERGSVLMLMPAAVLVVVVLSALTVDLAVVHLGRARLVHAAEAAANDAATVGLDEARLRAGQGLRLDEARVERAVQASLAASDVAGALAGPPRVVVLSPTAVQVELAMEVRYVFAQAIPGSNGSARVVARATATADRR